MTLWLAFSPKITKKYYTILTIFVFPVLFAFQNELKIQTSFSPFRPLFTVFSLAKILHDIVFPIKTPGPVPRVPLPVRGRGVGGGGEGPWDQHGQVRVPGEVLLPDGGAGGGRRRLGWPMTKVLEKQLPFYRKKAVAIDSENYAAPLKNKAHI